MQISSALYPNCQDPNHSIRFLLPLGAILEGPGSNVLQTLVSQALPVIVEMMGDSVVAVKDTAAWTLGRISELHAECLTPDDLLRNVVLALVKALEDSPRVAANASWVRARIVASLCF